jgi:hypothetical protein
MMSIGPEHRQAVRNETIVSIAINSLIPAAIIWFVEARPPQTLTGEHGILGSMLPAAGLATLLMTLVLTTIVRFRVRKGVLPALDWPQAERGVMAWIPGNMILRAIALALLALVLLVPAGLVIVALTGVLPLTSVGFLIFNLIFGAAVGLVMARFVVLPALADPVR